MVAGPYPPVASGAYAGAHLAAQPAPQEAPVDGQPASKRPLILGAGAATLLLIVVLVGVVVSLAGDDGGGGSKATGNGQTLRGIAVLLDGDGNVEGTWDTCSGSGGYDDFSAGMALRIRGASDEIVGSGSVVNVTGDNIEDVARAELDGDHAMGLEGDTLEENVNALREFLIDGEDIACVLYFEAEIEPSDYYSVEMADRGRLDYSKDRLAQEGYVVGINLGDF
jgi:hypothetical protein